MPPPHNAGFGNMQFCSFWRSLGSYCLPCHCCTFAATNTFEVYTFWLQQTSLLESLKRKYTHAPVWTAPVLILTRLNKCFLALTSWFVDTLWWLPGVHHYTTKHRSECIVALFPLNSRENLPDLSEMGSLTSAADTGFGLCPNLLFSGVERQSNLNFATENCPFLFWFSWNHPRVSSTACGCYFLLSCWRLFSTKRKKKNNNFVQANRFLSGFKLRLLLFCSEQSLSLSGLRSGCFAVFFAFSEG